MAYFQFKHVRIAGISAGVPAHIVRTVGSDAGSSEYDAAAFAASTGVFQKRISDELTAADLCYGAAERLIADLGWDKSDIGVLVFVSYTPDYIMPATACILQDRLGLSKECYATDVAMGCSGWVYGLSHVVSLLASGSVKKGLLLAGDAKKRAPYARDPLFGDAGTATAIEFIEGDDGFQFHFGTDGSGYDAIIIPDGGSRNQVTAKSFEYEEYEGRMIHRLQVRMKGMDVFSFGISTAPKSVKKLAEHFGLDLASIDFYIFHQANMMMNDIIRKKLKLAKEKVPNSMPVFGNTISASIPLTIVSQLKGKIENKSTSFICCGFGVGLSWGTVAFKTTNIIVSDLLEL